MKMKKLLSLLLLIQTSIGYSQFYSYGCTDPSSSNYSGTSFAYDSGACCYETSMRVVYSEGGFVQITSFNNTISAEFYPGELMGIACLPDGCYNVLIMSTGYSQFNFESTDGQVFSYTLQDESFNFQFTIGELISGCNDYTACNYNPNVNCELEECIYDCIGCTNPLAENYEPNATMDSGTCVLDTYTLNISSDVEWIIGDQQGTTVNGSAQFTISGECNLLHIYVGDFGEQASYNITNGDGELVTEGITSTENYPTTVYLCFDNTIGCTDVNACNYDPNAFCSSFFTCEYDCYGCMDIDALNYDPTALIDDGNCCYEYLTFVVTGDTFLSITELDYSNSTIGYANSSVDLCYHGGCVRINNPLNSSNPFSVEIYNSQGDLLHTEDAVYSGLEYYMYFIFSDLSVPGCNDPFACNYNPEVTCYDYSCDYSCHGCTDPSAPNYNADATIENGSCCTDNWYSLEFSEPCFWYVQNTSTGLFAYGNYPEESGFCADQFSFPNSSGLVVFDEHLTSYSERSIANCFEFQAFGLSGNALEFIIYNPDGEIIASSSGESGIVSTEVAANLEDISGCMDMNACNYNPNATCHSNNCEYECGGCTDNTAINYMPNALWEDGSCFYTVQAPDVTYQIVNADDGSSYSVIFTINDFGNGEQYIISNDYNTEQVITSGSNTYEMGPFACFSEINFKFRSTVFNLTEFLNLGPISHDCTIISANEIETVLPFGLYPNPTTGFLTISGLYTERYKVVLFDLTGRRVSQEFINGSATFDLSNLANGCYLLQIEGSTSTFTKTFVKSSQ